MYMPCYPMHLIKWHFGLEEQWLPYEAHPALTPACAPLIARPCRQTLSITSRRDNSHEELTERKLLPRFTSYLLQSVFTVKAHRTGPLLCGVGSYGVFWVKEEVYAFAPLCFFRATSKNMFNFFLQLLQSSRWTGARFKKREMDIEGLFFFSLSYRWRDSEMNHIKSSGWI